jgi:hypothetical protein
MKDRAAEADGGLTPGAVWIADEHANADEHVA